MRNYGIIAALALLLSACSADADQPQTKTNPWTGEVTSSQPSVTAASNNNATKDGEVAQTAHPAADPVRQQQSKLATCDDMFPGGIPPRIVNPQYAKAIQPTYKELCYRSFALGHSGLTRTAIWSAEMLDLPRMKSASSVKRDSQFEADPNLPANQRSELEDYRHSGYDRGHLAPSADMPSADSQAESFRLSNIVPQNGSMNGGTWRELEMKVRREAYKRKVYIVTGPIFENSHKALKKRVLVPTSMYKAMFSVERGAVVFIVTNDKAARVTTLSLDQFATIYGIDPFPALTGIVRKHNIALSPIPVQPGPEDPTADGGTASGEVGAASGAPCREFQDSAGSWVDEGFFKLIHPSEEPRAIRSCTR